MPNGACSYDLQTEIATALVVIFAECKLTALDGTDVERQFCNSYRNDRKGGKSSYTATYDIEDAADAHLQQLLQNPVFRLDR